MLMVTPAPPQTAKVTQTASTATPAGTGDAQGSSSAAPPDVTKPGPTPMAPPAAAEPQQTAQAEPPAPTADAPPQPPAQPEQAKAGSDLPPAIDPPMSQPEPQQASNNNNNAGTTTAANSAAATTATTHVVEMGETFSTISLKAYGNPNLYAGIMRANPGVDPAKLRPGMKIVVPPISEVRPPTPPASAAPVAAVPIRTISTDAAQMAKSTKAETPIDPQTQYRVQPGDSLYSIAKRLYGRGDRSTRIFEANKQTLGDDMNALKPGQVLTLPEPPAAARQ